MSASREKKKRQELLASGAVDPKAARAAEEKAAARKTNLLYGTLGVVLVVVTAALLLYNSNFITRGRTAVTIDGKKYSVAETAYYYGQAYQNFASSSSGYYMMMYGMLDTSKPLSTQSYPYSDSMTWADYFKDEAVSTMRFVHALKKAAAEDGVDLESEELETYDANVEAMKSAAEEAGCSYQEYLTRVYGDYMTVSAYEGCMRDQMLANKYATRYEDSLEFSEDEISAYYEENKNSYDMVDGSYVTISGLPVTQTDEEGNTIEATEEEKTAALEAARAAIQEIMAAYQEGGDLEELAGEHDAAYITDKEMTYSSDVAHDWLFSDERAAGDVELLEDEANSRFYIAVFNSRQRIEYPNYNVRHILVTEANLELGEDEEATNEMIEAKAQEILESWDGTEEGFAALAEEYSQDGGSNTNGGLYEDVLWGSMVEPFQAWCYEDGRTEGDTGIIYSEDTGYHIMYFKGYSDDVYWHYNCEEALVTNAYNEWADEMTNSVAAEVHKGAMSSI